MRKRFKKNKHKVVSCVRKCLLLFSRGSDANFLIRLVNPANLSVINLPLRTPKYKRKSRKILIKNENEHHEEMFRGAEHLLRIAHIAMRSIRGGRYVAL